jgi:hypothetical protein
MSSNNLFTPLLRTAQFQKILPTTKSLHRIIRENKTTKKILRSFKALAVIYTLSIKKETYKIHHQTKPEQTIVSLGVKSKNRKNQKQKETKQKSKPYLIPHIAAKTGRKRE